ncbi:TPA: hypothetical protein MEI08_002626 [Klebsiella quasipneumoniae subsp. similipneumoniae]|nr:hypothetical protein [Klebsiella quasipneumoniae subsp. similipneumoniae]
MQIGFIGLGAVVETAYLPALRRLGYRIDSCQGYDLDSSRALPGIQRWTRPGAIYAHCLDEQILGVENVFTRAPESVAGLTWRRLEEVEWLLRLQQQLRGPH